MQLIYNLSGFFLQILILFLIGPPDYGDIDYTSDDTFQAHWYGFIDHESGIKVYRVGLASRCLSKMELYEANTSKSNSVIADVLYPENSLRLPANFSGKNYVTVIALNNAMDPSEPACSDGISKDTSPPQIRNITVANAKWTESIYCSENITWFLRSDLVKVQLRRSDACRGTCNSPLQLPFLESIRSNLLSERTINAIGTEDINIESDFICSEFPEYDSNLIYIPNDHIFIKWDFEEDISQIHDFMIGIGKTSSEKDTPGIVRYVSTSKKTFFKISHAGIGTNSEFFIFLKAINKAGLHSIAPIGPLLIDQTPPNYLMVPDVKITGDYLIVGWENDTFYDDEQTDTINRIMFQIGNYFKLQLFLND